MGDADADADDAAAADDDDDGDGDGDDGADGDGDGDYYYDDDVDYYYYYYDDDYDVDVNVVLTYLRAVPPLSVSWWHTNGSTWLPSKDSLRLAIFTKVHPVPLWFVDNGFLNVSLVASIHG